MLHDKLLAFPFISSNKLFVSNGGQIVDEHIPILSECLVFLYLFEFYGNHSFKQRSKKTKKKKKLRSFTPKFFLHKVSNINSQNTSSNLLLCCFTFYSLLNVQQKIPRNTSVKYEKKTKIPKVKQKK